MKDTQYFLGSLCCFEIFLKYFVKITFSVRSTDFHPVAPFWNVWSRSRSIWVLVSWSCPPHRGPGAWCQMKKLGLLIYRFIKRPEVSSGWFSRQGEIQEIFIRFRGPICVNIWKNWRFVLDLKKTCGEPEDQIYFRPDFSCNVVFQPTSVTSASSIFYLRRPSVCLQYSVR